MSSKLIAAATILTTSAELHSATARAAEIAIKSNDEGTILQVNRIMRVMTAELKNLSNLGRPDKRTIES